MIKKSDNWAPSQFGSLLNVSFGDTTLASQRNVVVHWILEKDWLLMLPANAEQQSSAFNSSEHVTVTDTS